MFILYFIKIDKAQEIINQWRSRLSDLSWLMRNLNEYIAGKANTGKQWIGGHRQQAAIFH